MIKLNGHKVEPTMFPDNTSQMWNLPKDTENIFNIEWEFEKESELIHVAQLATLANKRNATSTLYMPFLPYGRQDKPVLGNTTFALKTFADIINTLGFSRVTTLDAHSSAFSEYFNNSHDMFPSSEITVAMNMCKPDALAYPDKGAVDRYADYNTPFIQGVKERDQDTGYISRYEVKFHKMEDMPKKVLMIDDICDGGMTFILFARKLIKMGAEEVSLYVTHGIFSKGTDLLHEAGISKIYTKDGLVSEGSSDSKYVTGCIIKALQNGDINILAHGVNCSDGFQSGLAGQIASVFPEVKERFHSVYNLTELGSMDLLQVLGGKSRGFVANCYTQEGYKGDGKTTCKGDLYLDYTALVNSLFKLFTYANENNLTVGIPKIGCGLAGGEWSKVKQLIQEIAPRDLKYKFYIKEN